jgi:pimeloyl-ACP methyl ester carboxylesterase
MTTPLGRASRLRAVLGRLGRALTALRGPGTPSTRFARNGPVTIAYDVRGRGSPLVLIQGVGIGRWGWEPVADRLARRFQVITIDNRGIGASDTPPGHFTTRAMAKDVLAVLDHAGIEHASVLGTSLGGMIAQELALAHPERVDRLVLVATLPGGSRSHPMPLGTTYLFASAPFLTSRAKLEQFVNTTLGPATLRRRPGIADRLAAAKLAHPQSEAAGRAQTVVRDAVQPARPATPHRPAHPGRAGHRRPGGGPRQRSRAGWPAPECPSGALRAGRSPAPVGAAQAVRARGDRLPHRPGHTCTRVEPNLPTGQLVGLDQGARR